MTNGDWLRAQAEQMGFPLISIFKAQESLARAKKTGADAAMARLMLRHARMTDKAREYVAREYPQ